MSSAAQAVTQAVKDMKKAATPRNGKTAGPEPIKVKAPKAVKPPKEKKERPVGEKKDRKKGVKVVFGRLQLLIKLVDAASGLSEDEQKQAADLKAKAEARLK